MEGFSFQSMLIGLGIGLIIAIVVYIWQLITRKDKEKTSQKEITKLKQMLTDRMDLEADGLKNIKTELEEMRKQNENMRITIGTLRQKPGRAEVQRLHVYQQAVDRLTINSPGFGAAWQAALKESEEDFKKNYIGTQAFIRKVLPLKTNAKLIDSEND